MKKVFTALTLCVVAYGSLGCGEVIEQNQLALVLRTIGDRESEAINLNTSTVADDATDGDASAEAVDMFESELITATRAPISRPGIVVLKFPLGVQQYKFSFRPTVESPDDESVTVDAQDGRVTFDVTMHMFIDETMPDIKDRLVKLMKAYQLRRYSGSPDVLKELIRGRFLQVLRAPFMEYASNLKTVDIIRDKTGMNKFVTARMNERFNPLGLRFTLSSISSRMEVPKTQQDRMNQAFLQDVNRQTLTVLGGEIRPLEAQIEGLRQDGKTEAARIIADARADRTKSIADAEKARREEFISLLGRENYVELEMMMRMTRSLKTGKTGITLVPDDARIIVDSPRAVRAAQ